MNEWAFYAVCVCCFTAIVISYHQLVIDCYRRWFFDDLSEVKKDMGTAISLLYEIRDKK